MKNFVVAVMLMAVGVSQGDVISDVLNPSMSFSASPQSSWTTSSDWFFKDGNYQYQDFVRSQSSSSTMDASITTVISKPGKLSFWWYSNSYQSSYGALSFLIDGVEEQKYSGYYDWIKVEKSFFTSTSKTLKWNWNKPSSYSYYYGAIADVRWEPAPSSFVLKFNACGGTLAIQEKTYSVGSKYGSLPTPTKAGCVFEGWYTQRHGGRKILTTEYADWDVAEVYAHWSGGSLSGVFNGISSSVRVNDSSKWSYGNGLTTLVPEYNDWNGEGEQIDNWVEAQIEGEGILSFEWILSVASTSQWANVDIDLELLVDGEKVYVNGGDLFRTSDDIYIEMDTDEGWCDAYFDGEGMSGEASCTSSFYLTPGVHTVKWRVSQNYCDGMEAYVSIGDLKFERVGDLDNIVDVLSLVYEYNVWRPGNMEVMRH